MMFIGATSSGFTSPLVPTTQQEKIILDHLFHQFAYVKQEFVNLYVEHEQLMRMNALLRKKITRQINPLPPEKAEVYYPLTPDENSKISSGERGNAIRQFAYELFIATQKAANFEAINIALSKENSVLQNSLHPLTPSPSLPQKTLLLHPSKEQELQESKPKTSTTFLPGDAWKKNLETVLEQHIQEITKDLSKNLYGAVPKKEILFAQFLNNFIDNRTSYIEMFGLSEEEVETLDIAIEYFAGDKMFITPSDFKFSEIINIHI
jgi:hypothetical protein